MNLTNLPMSLDEVPLPSSLPPVILTTTKSLKFSKTTPQNGVNIIILIC